MGLLRRLGLDEEKIQIDWEMTPADTYGLFECRGDMRRVRSKDERYYYFYIDNWQQPARLCLMERGIRHARVLAYIDAPVDMINRCVREQGTTYKENSYAINAIVRQWLEDYVIDSDDSAAIVLPAEQAADNCPMPGVPSVSRQQKVLEGCRLRSTPAAVSEDEIERIVRQGNFFESRYNSTGFFHNSLVLNHDGQTVTDMRTSIIWQLRGSGHTSIRKLRTWIAELNRAGFGGYNVWRLPTIDEALSLLKPEKNDKGLHIDGCFSVTQPYVFTADRRQPGGFWLVDFGRARVYWAAGSCFSGGFGRACCSGYARERLTRGVRF